MFKLLRLMKQYRLESVLAPLFKMLEALFELFVPLVVADIIDNGINRQDRAVIIRGAILMTVLAIVGLTASITAQYFSAKAAVGFATKLRLKLFRHVQGFSYTENDGVGTSTMITRLTNDVNQVQSGVNLTLRLLLRSPFIVFGSMIMAFTIDTKSALTFAVSIPILSVIVFGIMLVSIPLYKKVQARLDAVLGHTRENLTGIRVIRAFGLESDEINRFDEANHAHVQMQKFTGKISALMNPLTYVVINFAVIALIYIGAWQVEGGEILQGELVALYNYMSQILVELIKLASLIISITKAIACGNRIQAVFECPVEETSGEASGRTETPENGSVVFENVSFSYRGAGENSLSGISFDAKNGEIFGVIGGTGSGKSSLVNLIPGFYPSTSGQILVGGKPIESLSLDALRAVIGIVPQKAVLFRGTIRSNLLFGNENASEAEMIEALKAAQAYDFVMQKEGGLDALVEQNGKNFSGGQRQRLCIARALVRRPQILILDDSSSALDYATDARLRESIRLLPYHPTIFWISQRTSSISMADQILVLDDGMAVGLGTHEELLASCSVYAEIHASQFGKEAK